MVETGVLGAVEQVDIAQVRAVLQKDAGDIEYIAQQQPRQVGRNLGQIG